MAKSEALTYKVTGVVPHPSTERALDVVSISNCKKYLADRGTFHSGQPVGHVPRRAILPQTLMEEFDLRAKLSWNMDTRAWYREIRETLLYGLLCPENGPICSIGRETEVPHVRGKIHFLRRVPAMMVVELLTFDGKIPEGF